MRTTLALCLIAGSAGIVGAEDLFQRPEGCVLMATSQFSDCEISNSYLCGAGEAGFFRTEVFAADAKHTIIHEGLDRGLIAGADSAGNRMTYTSSTTVHPRIILRDGTGRLAIEAVMTFEGKDYPITFTQDMSYAGQQVEAFGLNFHRIDAETELVFPGLGAIPGMVTFGYLPETDLLVKLQRKHEIPGDEELVTLKALSLPGEDGAGDEIPRFGCEQQGWLNVSPTKVPA